MFPKNLTFLVKNANPQKLGLLTKLLSNTEKFKNSIPLFGEDVISEYNSIRWEEEMPHSVKLQWIKQDIFSHPLCKSCGKKLKWIPALTKYNDSFCNAACYGKSKQGTTTLEVDISKVKEMYLDQKMSLLEIAKVLGNVSNVSLKHILRREGVMFRTHSENQQIHVYRGPYNGPKIQYDPETLRHEYVELRTPAGILAKKYKCNGESIRRFLHQLGEKTNQHRKSQIEHIVQQILEKHNIRFKPNDRQVLGGLEIDFLLLDHNVGLELHGLATHSVILGKKDKKYHQAKFDLALAKGWKLYQFWEPDIFNKTDIIESMILSACKLTPTKIFARKCEVREISSSDTMLFCKDNHLQGAPNRTNINLGLFSNGQLVSVLCAQRKEVTTIVRFCSKTFTSVVGGFSKLLSRLAGKIVTYSSNNYSQGEVYQKHGFVVKCESLDLHYTDYKKILNRRMFQKSKLANILKNFDSMLTEQQNMISNGFDIIWGAGTKTWVLDKAMK